MVTGIRYYAVLALFPSYEGLVSRLGAGPKPPAINGHSPAHWAACFPSSFCWAIDRSGLGQPASGVMAPSAEVTNHGVNNHDRVAQTTLQSLPFLQVRGPFPCCSGTGIFHLIWRFWRTRAFSAGANQRNSTKEDERRASSRLMKTGLCSSYFTGWLLHSQRPSIIFIRFWPLQEKKCFKIYMQSYAYTHTHIHVFEDLRFWS